MKKFLFITILRDNAHWDSEPKFVNLSEKTKHILKSQKSSKL